MHADAVLDDEGREEGAPGWLQNGAEMPKGKKEAREGTSSSCSFDVHLLFGEKRTCATLARLRATEMAGRAGLVVIVFYGTDRSWEKCQPCHVKSQREFGDALSPTLSCADGILEPDDPTSHPANPDPARAINDSPLY